MPPDSFQFESGLHGFGNIFGDNFRIVAKRYIDTYVQYRLHQCFLTLYEFVLFLLQGDQQSTWFEDCRGNVNFLFKTDRKHCADRGNVFYNLRDSWSTGKHSHC